KQKQQVIGSFKNMKETKLHKPKRGLVPAGVKPHQSRVAQKFERANNPRRRHKTQNRNNAQAQALKGRVNRELRTVRLNRIVEQYIQHRLIPVKVDVVGKPRARNVRERLIVRRK